MINLWIILYRLSLKACESSRGFESKTIDQEDWDEENESAPMRSDSAVGGRLRVERPRTANSIPNKSNYMFQKAPELNLEYGVPNSPEKYLLPVRFPKLYGLILKSIKKHNEKIQLELERQQNDQSQESGILAF